MKKLVAVGFVVLGLLAGCDSTTEDVALAQKPIIVPSIDTSKITTLDDYQAAKSALWDAYESAKIESFADYEKAKYAAFNVWYAFDRSELKKLREADRENYLKWVDAEKINDFRTQMELEKTVPAIVAYKKASNQAYITYETKNKSAYDLYKAADAQAYKLYQANTAKAYEAYSARKKH